MDFPDQIVLAALIVGSPLRIEPADYGGAISQGLLLPCRNSRPPSLGALKQACDKNDGGELLFHSGSLKHRGHSSPGAFNKAPEARAIACKIHFSVLRSRFRMRQRVRAVQSRSRQNSKN